MVECMSGCSIAGIADDMGMAIPTKDLAPGIKLDYARSIYKYTEQMISMVRYLTNVW